MVGEVRVEIKPRPVVAECGNAMPTRVATHLRRPTVAALCNAADRVSSGVPDVARRMPPSPSPRHDPIASLRQGNFLAYLVGSLLSNTGNQMRAVAVGWEV